MKNLNSAWSIWYTHREPHVKTASQNYEEQMKLIASFSTVEDFWNNYQHLKKPSDMPIISDYIYFRQGIRPMWEDEQNLSGGKWILRLKKGIADRLWENLLLAVIGEQFDGNNEICGIVLSMRTNEDIISIWNRNSHPSVTANIRETMKSVLGLPADTFTEYKPHKLSLKVVVKE